MVAKFLFYIFFGCPLRYVGVKKAISRRNARLNIIILGYLLSFANQEIDEDLNLYFLNDYKEELRLINELKVKSKYGLDKQVLIREQQILNILKIYE